MTAKVDLYNSAYRNYRSDPYRMVRLETYGEDFGQTSWVTNQESREISKLLRLQADSSVLEIGCGSGGYAVHLAERVGCRIHGLDMNESGVRNANRLATAKGLGSKAHFERRDASKKLPFGIATFDAVFSNDVLCHIPRRHQVLREMFRVLRPGGRMLFSDALVIGGMLTHEEIATRSSIGYYVYSPPGENERLLERAGFTGIRATDTTRNAARIAGRWRRARHRRKKQLVTVEGRENYEGLQRFLACVHTLTSERRLLRFLYVTTKPA